MQLHSLNTFPGLFRIYVQTSLTETPEKAAEACILGEWFGLGLFFETTTRMRNDLAWTLLYNDRVNNRTVATLSASPSRRIYSANGLSRMDVRDISTVALNGDNILETYAGVLQPVNKNSLHKLDPARHILFRARDDYFVLVAKDDIHWDWR